MKVHIIQHDPLVGSGIIQEWMKQREHGWKKTRPDLGEKFPSLDTFDLLVVLGGRMGAYEESKYPWLAEEKAWLKNVVAADKMVLGICLGAQLIADALGGKAYKHRHPEIGWWPVTFNKEAADHPLLSGLRPAKNFFEYHDDTFELPDRAVLHASSKATTNQMFTIGDNVLAVQFHPEFRREEIENALSFRDLEQLEPTPYVRSVEQMFNDEYEEESRRWFMDLLDRFEFKAKDAKELSPASFYDGQK